MIGAMNTHLLEAYDSELPVVQVAQSIDITAETQADTGLQPVADIRKGHDCCDCCCCLEPCYSHYVTAEGLFWGRGNATQIQPLVVRNPPAMSTNDPGFGYEPGLRFTFGITRGPNCCCDAWEFGYLGLWDSDASAVVTDANNLRAAGILGVGIVNGFVNSDTMRAEYSSNLNSFEANCVKFCCRRYCVDTATRRRELDVMYGFRYASFSEDFALASDNIPRQVNAIYSVSASNDLYGAQLGARWRGYRNRLGIEAVGKAGIYYNVASQQQTIVDQLPNNPFVLRKATGTSSDVAFLGEFGLSLLYEFLPAMTLRCGYSLLLLEGVALAPDQMDFATLPPGGGTAVNVHGGVLYHGVNFGLEFRH
jgi:hypothetical protein